MSEVHVAQVYEGVRTRSRTMHDGTTHAPSFLHLGKIVTCPYSLELAFLHHLCWPLHMPTEAVLRTLVDLAAETMAERKPWVLRGLRRTTRLLRLLLSAVFSLFFQHALSRLECMYIEVMFKEYTLKRCWRLCLARVISATSKWGNVLLVSSSHTDEQV